jgi:hypothetical protein
MPENLAVNNQASEALSPSDLVQVARNQPREPRSRRVGMGGVERDEALPMPERR